MAPPLVIFAIAAIVCNSAILHHIHCTVHTYNILQLCRCLCVFSESTNTSSSNFIHHGHTCRRPEKPSSSVSQLRILESLTHLLRGPMNSFAFTWPQPSVSIISKSCSRSTCGFKNLSVNDLSCSIFGLEGLFWGSQKLR